MTDTAEGTVRLFHCQVFMPSFLTEEALAVQTRLGKAKICLSFHVGQHCDEEMHRRSGQPSQADRSHAYTREELGRMIACMAEKPLSPFEVEATYHGGSWQVTKYAVRLSFSEKTDIVIVVRPKEEETVAFIVTAYLNSQDDCHSTLDRSKYDTSL